MAKKTVKPEVRTVDKETGEVIVTPAVVVDEPTQEEIDTLMRRGFRRAFHKSPNNHNTQAASQLSATRNSSPTLTQQHEAKATDINEIMRRFGVTGTAPGARTQVAFMDVPEDISMQTAIDLVRAGQEEFEKLPAMTRAYFRNDLGLYATTVEDLRRSGNTEALRSLGIEVIASPPPPNAAEKGSPPKGEPPSPPRKEEKPKETPKD